MPRHFQTPQKFPQEGIEIQEIVGIPSSGTREISVARIQCASNWSEPSQTPEFDEYSFVISGRLGVRTDEKTFWVAEGEAILTAKGERVQYLTGPDSGADYLSICLPAFRPEATNREDDAADR